MFIQDREIKLKRYIDSLTQAQPEFSIEAANLAWSIWVSLKEIFLDKNQLLDVPNAAPGARDNFMLVWSEQQYYLECEVFADGKIEFFYHNRDTNESWGEDTRKKEFSAEIIEKVSIFAHSR